MFEFNCREYDSWEETPTWARIIAIIALLSALIAFILVATGVVDNNQMILGIPFKVIEINLFEF
jgi:hypothetical protein